MVDKDHIDRIHSLLVSINHNQLINQSINQSIDYNQSIDKSIDKSTDQSIKHNQ